MASQALYRKWRSQTFQELIGQEAVVRTLKNALQSGRVAHAYLFCGPRGIGKTSAARLLAKTVNCQNPQAGEPCNACPNCREISEGRSLDVIEIDAASNRGIDEIRDLRERVSVRPANSKYKVYVLDEAHMLTTEACNALLKTLEEPPPYVIFVLATTEAHRMLATMVSRCQRFDFKRHTFRNTVRHLHYIAGQEGVTLENGAAELLARAAGGGMRDALSLLDQAIAAMGQTITQTGVQQMLGLADPHAVRELVEHIALLRGADGLHLINTLAEAGADLRQLSAQVAEYWRAMLLARTGADVVEILDRTPEEAAEIRQLAESFALDELSACARLFSQNDVGARAITIPQLAVELAFIDCLHLHRQRSETAPTNPTSAAPKAPTRPAPASPPVPRPTPSQATAGTPAQNSSTTPQASASAAVQTIREAAAPVIHEAAASLADEPDEIENLDLDAPPVQEVEAIEDVFAPGAFEDDEEAEEPAAAAAQTGLTLEMVSHQWEMVKKACKTRTPKLAALLNSASPVAVTGADGGEIALQVEYDFHYKKLLEPESRSVIEWAFKEILQYPCRCRFLQKDEPIPLSTTPTLASSNQPGAGRSAEPAQPSAPDAPPRQATSAAPGERVPDALPAQNGHGASAAPGKTRAAQASAPPANSLEAQVRQDPIVTEIIKTYGAKLVEWEPLKDDM
ncbi:MAG TPA: DNA polymerase III subunit gamma/tau [Ktedonobacterales bacterium]